MIFNVSIAIISVLCFDGVTMQKDHEIQATKGILCEDRKEGRGNFEKEDNSRAADQNAGWETLTKGKVRKDFSGLKVNRIEVLSYEGQNKSSQSVWLCRCDCGTLFRSVGKDVVKGHTKSCGCWQREARIITHTTHGQSKSPTWVCWVEMLKRCRNTKFVHFKHYGGRGITVCERWLTYEQFIQDVGERPTKGHTLDRWPNNDGNYEPGNVRWATWIEQGSNKRNNRIVRINEVQKTLAQWCRDFSINPKTVYSRLSCGWNEVDAITKPISSI
jgi:hypothetical protein